MGWLKDCIDNKRNIGRYAEVPAYFNFIGLGNENDKESGINRTWKRNTKINLEWFKKSNGKVVGSIDALPTHEGKAIVFVGMSPVIKRSWKYLKGLDERFIIVATNSSAKYLLDRGITPHYVIAIDGNPGTWTLKLGEKAKDIIGIFSTNVDPGALEDWPGKVYVIPHGIAGNKALTKKVEKAYGPSFPGGGNALNCATLVFLYKSAARIFLYAGNELSFKRQYYADRKCPHDNQPKFYTKDIFGKKVKTLFPLYEYKIFLENLASQIHGDYFVCNCSEGILGVDTDGSLLPFIGQMRLDIAIKEVGEAMEYENLPVEEKAKIFYDESYQSGVYHPRNTKVVWDSVLENGVTFTKALDVGCGMGTGIKECRDKGMDVYGADLADNQEHWKKIGIGNYCFSEPAHKMHFKDNEFDFVLCSEVMEHIPESQVDDTLEGILRVGSNRFIYTICLEPEPCPIAGIMQSHITIKPMEWWLSKFASIGYKRIGYSDTARGKAKLQSLVIDCYKYD